MEILLVTKDFRSYGLAHRLIGEGHTVRVFSSHLTESFGDGMLEFVSHPFDSIKSCKFILADAPVSGQIYEWAKTFNKPIIGASLLTDIMNVDVYREYQIAKRLGVELPETEVVDDVSSMYSKVLDWNPTRTVIRYDRESITIDHQSWMAWALHSLPLNKRILLQTSSYGEAVEVMGWFDGLHWARPFLFKSHNDAALKASTLLALYDRDWVEKTIAPWGQFLRVADYRGPFKIRLLVSSDSAQLASSYAGFEFPSVYAFFEGLKEPAGDFLNRIAFSICERYDITTDFMSAISVTTAIKEPDGIPILGIDEGNVKHIFFGSVSKLESGIVIRKGLPWIYVVTAHGRDLEESLGRAYFTSKVVKIPEPLLMTNLASAYKPWLNKANNLGYI